MNKTELPKDWKWVKLGEACEIIMGQSPPSTTYNMHGIGLPFFQGKAEFTDLHPIVEKWCDTPNKIAETNDILLSVRAPVGTTNIANQKCCIGRGLAAIRFENYKYAFYFLRSKQHELDSKGTGTTFRAISGETIRETLFPLSPKPTQQAIVSKIEELFSELDKAIENLRTAQQQLKTYRQAVLKWAFEGKLTNENLKKGELPNGWKLVKLGDVAKKKSVKALPVDYPDAKFIGMDCIEPHTLKPFFLYDFKEFRSAGNYFKMNQVLYGRMRPYLNKVYKAEFDGTCSGEFIILDCGEILNPDLLKYILHSRGFVSFANSITTGDRPRISYEEISDYDIFLPPIEAQKKIVEEIESRLSVADKMEESITQSLQQAEALRESILKKAFEGRLV